MPRIDDRCRIAITLWQPWASFIAAGVKPFETRDWPPPAKLIGMRIAIHAAKHPVSPEDREWATEQGCTDLPLGAVVCTAILRGAYQCHCLGDPTPPADILTGSRVIKGSPPKAVISDDPFGDYSAGRWAWWLTDIEPINPAIPARGSQGFWKWSMPDAAD